MSEGVKNFLGFFLDLLFWLILNFGWWLQLYLINNSCILVSRIWNWDIFPWRNIHQFQSSLKLHHVIHWDGNVGNNLKKQDPVFFRINLKILNPQILLDKSKKNWIHFFDAASWPDFWKKYPIIFGRISISKIRKFGQKSRNFSDFFCW